MMLDPDDVIMKLELLQALADHHNCTHIHFWRVPKHGAACALGPLALLTSNKPIEDEIAENDTEWKLLTFTPKRRKSLAALQIPIMFKVSSLVECWPSYVSLTDLSLCLVDKIQELVKNGQDIIGRHVDAFEHQQPPKNVDLIYEDIILASSKGESLEKLAVERRLNLVA
jgi:hypothetical protein